MFIGDLWMPPDEAFAVVPRPRMADIAIVDTDTMTLIRTPTWARNRSSPSCSMGHTASTRRLTRRSVSGRASGRMQQQPAPSRTVPACPERGDARFGGVRTFVRADPALL
jgi:hypothetical protein